MLPKKVKINKKDRYIFKKIYKHDDCDFIIVTYLKYLLSETHMFLNDMDPNKSPILTEQVLGRKKESYDNGLCLAENLEMQSKFFKKALIESEDDLEVEYGSLLKPNLIGLLKNVEYNFYLIHPFLTILKEKYESKFQGIYLIIDDTMNNIKIIKEIYRKDNELKEELNGIENFEKNKKEKFKVYEFRVSFDVDERVFRKIKIRDDNSLKVFAYAILESINFDDDHLYQFNIDNEYGKEVFVSDGEGKQSVDIPLKDINLKERQLFHFWYDFGDNWFFNITVEKIEEKNSYSRPRVIERKGRIKQHRDIEDEEKYCYSIEDETSPHNSHNKDNNQINLDYFK